MLNTKVLQRRLADKTEELLNSDPNRDRSMQELADKFLRNGLLDNADQPRKDSPRMFVRDLIRDNPLVPDWLNLQQEQLQGVNQDKSVSEVLDRL